MNLQQVGSGLRMLGILFALWTGLSACKCSSWRGAAGSGSACALVCQLCQLCDSAGLAAAAAGVVGSPAPGVELQSGVLFSVNGGVTPGCPPAQSCQSGLVCASALVFVLNSVGISVHWCISNLPETRALLQ